MMSKKLGLIMNGEINQSTKPCRLKYIAENACSKSTIRYNLLFDVYISSVIRALGGHSQDGLLSICFANKA